MAAAALVVLAFAASARASTDDRLLAKHRPILVFHPGEEFRPTSVERFVRDSTLEVATSPTTWTVVDPAPTADTLPTASPPVWRLNQRNCSPSAPLGGLACYVAAASDARDALVYGRVAREGRKTVLQYWLFYYANVYRYPFAPLGALWQAHEGDWEVVNVVLGPGERPVAVALSQHCSGEVRRWNAAPRRGRHAVVRVALGSHANYFDAGLHEIQQACVPPEVLAFFARAQLPLPADVAASTTVKEARQLGQDFEVREIGDGPPPWVAFPGFWGELEYFHAPPPIGTVPFGPAPLGPAFHRVWDAPLATIAGWQ
ncbi:MAG: hypothetical protein ICV74_01340 [Thermoleophilia bacterium]|nr:hypothetical protein [Thermoleophilia bacterium]